MKKIYSMIALLMVCMVGMAQSNHKKWQIVDENSPILSEADLVGKNVVLQQGYNTETWDHDYFLSTTSTTATSVTEDCIFQFVETGEMSGEDKLYVLKNIADNSYVSNGNKAWVSNENQAFVFTAKVARAVDEANYDAETYVNDIVELRRAGDAEGLAFVLYSPTDQQYMNFVGMPGFFDPSNKWYDTTNWVIFEVEEVEKLGEEAIAEILENDLYEGQVSQAQFPVGNVPGSISQELYTALETAYNEAMALYELEDVTEEMWWAAADKLKAAIEAAKNGVKPVTAGYYQILAFSPAATDGTPSNGRGVYAAADGVRWTSAYEPITEVDYDKAAYIWQLIPAESEEGDELSRFYIKNFGEDNYLGTHTGNSQIIPLTAEAEEKWGFLPTSEKSRGGYFDVVNATRGNGVSFNCDPTGIVVFWTTAAGDNGFFRFVAVDQAIIDEMSEQVEKNRKLAALEAVYATAETAYEKGRVYTLSDDCETGTYEYNIPGVFIYNNDENNPNAFTNAPEPAEGENGPAALLFDNDLITYFHTAWSTEMAGSMGEGKELHYLQVNLDEALQNITLKYTQRRNNGGWPLKFLVSVSEDGETWTDECEVALPYQVAAPEDHTGHGGKTGYTAFQMSKAYKYLRFSSLDNGQNKLFWHMAEMRFYEGGGEYDAASSTYETVDKAYRDELEKQMAAARAEIEAGEATEATTEALKKAVEDFNEHYPDMAVIDELLEEANSWLEVGSSLEGDELGYIEVGATTELETALAAATDGLDEEGLMLTYDQIQEAKEKIRAAINDFNNKLIVPEDGTVYRIQSASTTEGEANNQTNKVLYAPNSDLEAVKYGYYDSENGVSSFEERIETLWKVIKNDDGTFMLRNLGTGLYLGNPGENDKVVKFTNDTDSAKVTFRSARVAGLFNIVMDSKEGVFANAQPGTGTIVTWGAAEGQDNSAFALLDADPSDYDVQMIDVTLNRYQIMTLPYSIENYTDYGTPLAVIGLKGNAIQLGEFEGENVPAGTPFIYFAYDESGSTEATTDYLTLVDPVDDMTYATEAAVHNGLLGTLTSFTLEEAGYGVLNATKKQVFVTEEGEEHYIYANTGIFGANIPATEEDGELFIEVVGELSKDVNTGIASAEIVKNNNVDVYTISGVKVRNAVRKASATNGLPSGLYIVGGKKVLVK